MKLPGILAHTEIDDSCPEPVLGNTGVMWMTPSLMYGRIERQVVYIERVYCGDSVKSNGHCNDCRRVIGEENLVGGWCIKSCQARLWFGIFMLLSSPAINPKRCSINGFNVVL